MISRVLQVHSSLFGEQGASSQLAQRLVDGLRARRPELAVRTRTLEADSVPHLDAETFSGFGAAPEQRNPRQQQRALQSDRLIDELRQADLLILGLPMYNFSVPSTVRAWFDHLARAGVSFRYTENGPEGLLGPKTAVVIATRGGRYQGPSDTQTPYVDQFLGFVGIGPAVWVYADGLAMGAEVAERSLSEARERIDALALELAGETP